MVRRFQKKSFVSVRQASALFGLQGSYGRGEQTADSDIDVVVIVDDMSHYDMLSYRNMIDAMDHSSMICGFVAGTSELRGWEKSDLLQLYLDTKPVIGSLDSFGFFLPRKTCAVQFIKEPATYIMPAHTTFFTHEIWAC